MDVLLLLLLGPIGQFKPILLALINLGLVAAGALIRPWLQDGRRIPTNRFPIGWFLILLVWSAPLLLQLASPVVPFLDVLPNHVAPVEHLRTFGTWEALSVDPSPIYGPSRLFLGYVAQLGALDVLTNLPAALAVAAFALPCTLLIAAGAILLAGSLTRSADGSSSETSASDRARSAPRSHTYWVMLTIPITFVFLRVPDSRASVLVFPLVCLALATLIGGGADRQDIGPSLRSGVGRRRAMVLAASIGAAVLVHPTGGAFLMATVLLCAPLSPERARLAIAGFCGGAVIALPQLALMIGINGPAWLAIPALPIGLGVAAWLGTTSGGALSSGLRAPSRDVGLPLMIGLVVVAGVAIVGILVAVITLPNGRDLLFDSIHNAVVDYGVLLIPGAIWVAFAGSLDGWRVIGAAMLVGLTALGIAEALPPGDLLIQSIAYEVPKEVGYWLPWFVAIAGGLGLAAVWDRREWAPLLRVGIPLAIVILASVDFQPGSIEEQGIEQHRYADTLAISLHRAQNGYWTGYPDSRQIVDAPRQALLAAVRVEIAAGRWRPDTPVLHVAPSFQQWVATPLGVFDGVIETDATEDPEHSLHTIGGRLMDIKDLATLLPQNYPYLVVEGYGPSNASLTQAAAAGYKVVWTDGQATLLHKAP